MKPFLTILVLLLTAFTSEGQTKTYNGKIIDFLDLQPLPLTSIYYNDTVLVGRANSKGSFSINIPIGIEDFSFRSLGYEEAVIKVSPLCDTLDIIMIARATYDFMTVNKINRLRYRDFKRLNKLHLEAYQKGIFNVKKPCFAYIFRKY